MANTHTLTVKDGALALNGEFLLHFYPAGDCDRIQWGAAQQNIDTCPKEWSAKLAGCIFDAVETGDIKDNHGEFIVVLPDNTTFDYLNHVQ